MPFGIISASEIFHRAMENMLEGVRCYVDDDAIWGSTLQEHNRRLHRVRVNGLKLSRAKCLFGVREITFLGGKLSADGIMPDERKIAAIATMPRQTDKRVETDHRPLVSIIKKNLNEMLSRIQRLVMKFAEANGKAEKGVHIIKQLLKKATD
uniref:Reverse transcriptase domain-containing protein n=1 Tax=Nothobranchius furzeri TaxID=105023 RepID=A0A1A8UXQ7_NOTFU